MTGDDLEASFYCPFLMESHHLFVGYWDSFCERKRYNAVLTIKEEGMRKRCHYRNQGLGQPERKEIVGREERTIQLQGELKHGLSLNRRYLNRKVRRYTGDALKGNQYRKICKTVYMVDFT